MSRIYLAVVVLLAVTLTVQATQCSDEAVSPVFDSWAAGKWQTVADEADFHHLMLSRVSRENSGSCSVGSGNGVAIWVDNNEQLSSAFIIVNRLRSSDIDSAVPIEVWHPNVLNTLSIGEFESNDDVTVRNLKDVISSDDFPWTSNVDGSKRVAAQGVVIANSRFQQVLFLDAFTIPVCDPAGLFEEAAFVASGMMMWSTPFSTSSQNPLWSVMGMTCEDSENWEQSGSLVLIDKSRHCGVVDLAIFIRSNQALSALFDGDSNVFRMAATMSRSVNITEAKVASPATPVGATYLNNGERRFCTHSVMYGAHFISNLNTEIFVVGGAVEAIKCYTGISLRRVEAVDEELISTLVRAQHNVPLTISMNTEPNACTVRKSKWEIEAWVAARPDEWINLDRFYTGESKDYQIVHTSTLKNCGDWFRCGADGWNNMDLYIKYLNVSSPSRGSQIDVRTKMSRNRGLGNDTYIMITDHDDMHWDCDYPIFGTGETHVSFFNIYHGQWYIIGVAWGPPKAQMREVDIILTVRLNGPIMSDGSLDTDVEPELVPDEIATA